MNRIILWLIIASIIIIVWFMTMVMSHAQPSDHMLQYHADADMDNWMRGLKRPDTDGYSCCNERDCFKTDAEWRGEQWWAEFKGVMVPVPPEKELDVLSFTGDAFLCAAPDRSPADPVIYCFVKPGMGF